MSEYKLPLDKLIPALIKFQAECPAIVKDKENTFITEKNKGKKAMYADLASIHETIKTVLAKHGFAISQPVCNGVLQTILYHESGQFIKSEINLSTEGKTAQAIGSEITYMRRYLLCSILGIAAEDDDDGNSASNNTTMPASRNTTAPANPAAKPKDLKCKINLGTKESPNYKMLTLAEVPDSGLPQVEWYAKHSNNEVLKAAANDFILNNAERFVGEQKTASTGS